jgi:Helix-turn-helix domain
MNMPFPKQELETGEIKASKPEWLRIPEAVRIFGIGRSSLYLLIREGRIRSCALRQRGAMRGIRLISYDSLVAFIEEQVEAASE